MSKSERNSEAESVLNEFPVKDLVTVLNYLYDERKDFAIRCGEDDDAKIDSLARRSSSKCHIYCSIARLQYWLDNMND